MLHTVGDLLVAVFVVFQFAASVKKSKALQPAPSRGKWALNNDDVRLTVCLSSITLICAAYQREVGSWKSITGYSIMTSSHIQDSGRPLIWNSLRLRISVKSDAIVMKFGTLNDWLGQKRCDKIQNFKIQHGRWTPYEKTSFLAINVQQIVRFPWNFYIGLDTKSCHNYGVMWKFQTLKIQDDGGPSSWTSSHRHISPNEISSDLMKLYMLK